MLRARRRSLPPEPFGFCEPGQAGYGRNTRSSPNPDHEPLRLIGHGVYGEVWLARNVVGTLRAVKVVAVESQLTTMSRIEI